jgi:hypothetical protein
MGRRNPSGAEIPGVVRTSVRLMYAGFAATVAALIASGIIFGRYSHAANVARLNDLQDAQDAANLMAGVIAIAIFAEVIGLICWIVIAVACRHGRGWGRVTGTILAVIYTLIMAFVLARTHDDAAARFLTVATWLLGVGAVIPLWSQQAKAFFEAWRRR